MLTESELCQDPKKNFEDAAPATLSREEELASFAWTISQLAISVSVYWELLKKHVLFLSPRFVK